jgi:glycosyltransferase involved in cell wall biosynthesis
MKQDTLKVCMYTPTAHGGHALYSQELLTALAEVGPRRQVAAELVTCENLAAENRTESYPIHAVLPRLVPRAEFANPLAWAASRLAYYSRRERVFLDWVDSRPDLDVVHFQEYTPWLGPSHFRRLRRRGLRLVFTVHNVEVHYFKNYLYKVVRDSSLRTAWRACDALLVHSEGLREALAGFLGDGHPPIHVTEHGVWRGADHRADPGSQATRPARDDLLFFGAIRPNKGLHVLLRAMDRLSRHRLTIAGPPEEKDYHHQVRKLAAQLPAERVEMVDRYVSDDELPGFFERCRLVILPYTFFASQSGVLHQALAYCRPVVATEVGALGECVRRWGIGEVVPPNDDRALAEGIERALRPERYDAAVEAIGRIRAELTWTRMAEATIDAYQAIVA